MVNIGRAQAYLGDALGMSMSILRSSFSVRRIGLEGVEQPLQTGLVVVVFLALNDHFLSAVYKLIAALLGEVLV